MYDLSILNSSRKKADDNLEKRNQEFEKVYNEALELFRIFITSHDNTRLEEATVKFSEAINLRQNNPGPYFFLAHIYFMYGRIDLSEQYFDMAGHLDPLFPGLDELRKIIYAPSFLT